MVRASNIIWKRCEYEITEERLDLCNSKNMYNASSKGKRDILGLAWEENLREIRRRVMIACRA
jgi:hypothetical protein